PEVGITAYRIVENLIAQSRTAAWVYSRRDPDADIVVIGGVVSDHVPGAVEDGDAVAFATTTVAIEDVLDDEVVVGRGRKGDPSPLVAGAVVCRNAGTAGWGEH